MPEYYYKARDRTGKLIEGSQDAASEDVVVSELTAQQYIPVEIVLVSTKRHHSIWSMQLPHLTLRRGPSKQTLASFCRQLYALYRAGVPLPVCMMRIAQTSPNKVLAVAIDEVREDMEAGVGLAVSMQKQTHVFPPLFAKLIQVGETTGRLESTFLQLAEYFELEADTIKKVKSLMHYPMLVTIAIIVAFSIINLFVIPAFSDFYSDLGANLPVITRLMISSSTFFSEHWPYIFGSAIILMIVILRFIKTPLGAKWFDVLALHFPILGSIYKRILFARFARSLAMIVRTGLPLTQGIELVAKALNNYTLERRIIPMRDDIARGESLLKSAERSGLFTPIMLQMLAVGEEAGSLEDSLDQIADFYESEVDYDIKRIGELIEPVLLVVIGLMVLILALGVFLPMWNLIGAYQ